jgi:alkyl hydroperoxide reductase subunit AhpF
MEKYTQLKQYVESLEADFEKFFTKGNKASGTRLRKGMQEIKKMAQDIRVEIQSKKKDSND